jgi:hypothetical protein
MVMVVVLFGEEVVCQDNPNYDGYCLLACKMRVFCHGLNWSRAVVQHAKDKLQRSTSPSNTPSFYRIADGPDMPSPQHTCAVAAPATASWSIVSPRHHLSAILECRKQSSMVAVVWQSRTCDWAWVGHNAEPNIKTPLGVSVTARHDRHYPNAASGETWSRQADAIAAENAP